VSNQLADPRRDLLRDRADPRDEGRDPLVPERRRLAAIPGRGELLREAKLVMRPAGADALTAGEARTAVAPRVAVIRARAIGCRPPRSERHILP